MIAEILHVPITSSVKISKRQITATVTDQYSGKSSLRPSLRLGRDGEHFRGSPPRRDGKMAIRVALRFPQSWPMQMASSVCRMRACQPATATAESGELASPQVERGEIKSSRGGIIADSNKIIALSIK